MASTMLGFAPGTVLKIASKPTLLMRGDRDGVIAASRVRYGTDEQAPDPVEKTFDEAYQASAESEAYDVLIEGANHFAIAHPLDETTGRFFLDMEMTKPAEEIREQIAGLVLAFIHKKDLQIEHAVVRKK